MRKALLMCDFYSPHDAVVDAEPATLEFYDNSACLTMPDGTRAIFLRADLERSLRWLSRERKAA